MRNPITLHDNGKARTLAIRKMRRIRRMHARDEYSKKQLNRLENSPILDKLEMIVAAGTSLAHRRALIVSEEVIYVRDGKIIRQVKDHCTIIDQIAPRKVTKGTVFLIDRSAKPNE